ncbi:MAG: DNA translocase FtsK [Patescibacteria group bacterium]|nr:DNA translocase FtsK [Patescibacteria group bacterium]
MAKKKKFNFKNKKESFWSGMDWSVNPDTGREIAAVAFIILGLFFVLSIFSAAGKVGLFFAHWFDQLFGIVGYLLPFVFLAIGLALWNPEKFKLKPSSTIGIILCFLFIPSLISPYGGLIGAGISGLFKNIFGNLAAYIILAGISVISLLVAFNTSLKNLFNKLSSYKEAPIEENISQNPTTKVSVFATVKNKIGLKQKPVAMPSANQGNFVPKEEGWEFPPLSLLESSTIKATSGNITKNVEIIQKTLSDFGIDVDMGDVNIGPTVTQYTLKPKEGIKLTQITARANDLALSLAAHPIRIEAPIPGKSAVGIEVPNKVPAIVTLKEMLGSNEFKHASNKSNLLIALGRNVAGEPVIIDLKKMPHMLVAGSTGTGKSICLHALLTSFLYQNSPAKMRLILVDPKRVEFTLYNGIPHLLAPVVTDVDKTVNVLRWAVSEMERRFKIFSETGRRDIESYNQNPPDEKMPYIVIIIDELADLMAQAANEVEAAIVRLAQMARAVGIHLIVATQRPSVDVITGLIKANITTRLAFAVASQIDSRTIIDQSGAEKLLGKGDMLYIGSDCPKPRRIQGAFIQEKEIKAVTEFIKKKGVAVYDESIINFKTNRKGVAGEMGEINDDLYEDAKALVIQNGKASASLLQRRMRIGYARAARLLDLLEEEGIIGPAEGAKPRDVLVDASSSMPDHFPTFPAQNPSDSGGQNHPQQY